MSRTPPELDDVGHEPWKQDETCIADIVRTMLAGGDARLAPGPATCTAQ